MHDYSYPDEVVLYIILANMVVHLQDVKIERTVDDMGVLLSLQVNPLDMGKVIGVAGSTAKSIRTILRCVGMKSDLRVNLKILEPARPEAPDTRVPLKDIDKII